MIVKGNDIVKGDIYGEWVVLDSSPYKIKGRKTVKCKCSCGNISFINAYKLNDGKTKMCRECHERSKTKHGHSRTPLYHIWQGMKQRCYDKHSISYCHYGLIGIKVCDRWLESFENFLEDMGERPSKEYSIDRIDNNGNYCPDNCRWATHEEQQNNMSSNRLLTYEGKTKSVSQWAKTNNINTSTLFYLINKGIPIGRALNYNEGASS
jgi:hypothetical protein